MSGKVIGGSARRGTAVGISFGKLVIGFRSINKSLIESVELITEENITTKKGGGKNVIGALGWGAAGGLFFGPLGGLAGLVFGGRNPEIIKTKTDVCFALYLTDGRKYLIISDPQTFQRIKAMSFK